MTKRWGEWQSAGDEIGSGGNGNVFRAHRDHDEAAIKVLRTKRPDHKLVLRFRDEIVAMKACADIPGVMPVLDHYPMDQELGPFWFAMPLGQSLGKIISADSLDTRSAVEAFRDFAAILAAMHDRSTYHRDIKPENLFRINGVWTIGDFGLIDFPDKDAVTAKAEKIGSAHYIAPEMLNTALSAKGAHADVYSLAKTLWVSLTGQRFPLPGEYRTEHDACRISSYVSGPRTGLLDRLMEVCTLSDAQRRPTMRQVVGELDAWLRPNQSETVGALNLSFGDLLPQLAAAKASSEEAKRRKEALQRARQLATLRVIDLASTRFVQMKEALQGADFQVEISGFSNGYSLVASLPTLHERNRVGIGCKLQVIDGVPPDPERLVITYELTFNRVQRAGGTVIDPFERGLQECLVGGPSEQSSAIDLIEKMLAGFRKLVDHALRNWRP